MALYVERVEQPSASVDWLATVPGQYLWNVTGITATLDTQGVTSAIVADASGNGNDGAYQGFVLRVAGAITDNLANRLGGGVGNYPLISDGLVTWTANWTIEYWARTDAIQPAGIWAIIGTGFSSPQFLQFNIDLGGGHVFLQASGPMGGGGVWVSPGGSLPVDGDWHHVAVTYVTATDTLNFFVDGANVGATENFGPWGSLALLDHIFIGQNPYFPSIGMQGYYDELAIYPAALSDAEIAAHYAARANIATYTPAVLTDNPAGFYHLEDIDPATGRQVDLVITDGSNTVLRVPTGFDAPTDPGPYSYSWQPTLRSSTQTPSSDAIAIAIPRLVLPAGYTVGTYTPGLQSTDQWSDINVWWDSNVMDSLHPRDPYAYPPGALLTYQGKRPRP